jgi:hypothetical protein
VNRISGHDRFILHIEAMVQELQDIEFEELTTFEQSALERMLCLLGRDEERDQVKDKIKSVG